MKWTREIRTSVVERVGFGIDAVYIVANVGVLYRLISNKYFIPLYSIDSADEITFSVASMVAMNLKSELAAAAESGTDVDTPYDIDVMQSSTPNVSVNTMLTSTHSIVREYTNTVIFERDNNDASTVDIGLSHIRHADADTGYTYAPVISSAHLKSVSYVQRDDLVRELFYRSLSINILLINFVIQNNLPPDINIKARKLRAQFSAAQKYIQYNGDSTTTTKQLPYRWLDIERTAYRLHDYYRVDSTR